MDGSIKEDEFKAWVEPDQALDRAIAKYGTKFAAVEVVGLRLRDGLLASAARNSLTKPSGSPERANSYIMLHKEVWERIRGSWLDQPLWKSGQLEVWFDHGNTRFSCHGIRFDPAGLDEFLPTSIPAEGTVTAPAKHAGGKPPKDIWERVWVEIAARLYSGALIPSKQADIESAIMEISLALGDGVETAAARRHAKPLWQKIKPEGS
jgi:hypothetical protein